MTDMIDEFDFSGSTGAAVAKESNKGGDFQREVQFLALDASESGVSEGRDRGIFRFVTDHERKPWMDGFGNTKYNFAWITTTMHYARTKQRPEYVKEGARWSEKMWAVCRKDKIFRAKYHDQCILHDQQQKASDRTWALAIEREQVIENGQIVGIRDKMREVLEFDADNKPIVLSQEGDKKTYKKKWVPAWTVMNLGWKNFFSPLNGQASYFQTVLGRDFFITRQGMGPNDTVYSFIPLDPIQMGGEWAQQAGVPEGTVYDLGMVVGQAENGRPIPMMERLYPDMPDLRRIIAERTSDDFYGRFFIPGWLPKDYDPSKSNAGAPQASGWAPTGGVQQGQMGNLQPGQQQGGVQQGYQPPVTPQPQATVVPQPQFQPPQAPQGQQVPQQTQQQPPQGQVPQQVQQQPQQAQTGPDEATLEALRRRVTGGAQQAPEGQQQVPQPQQ